MSHWPFIVAAYAVALLATAVLVGWSYSVMRRAEAAVEALKDRR
jgi:heme exporter protein CcmD